MEKIVGTSLRTTVQSFCGFWNFVPSNGKAQWGAPEKAKLMLQHFTWTQFLLTSTALSFLWYSAVLLIAYRTELFALIKGNEPIVKKTALALEGQMVDADGDENQPMGKSRMPEGLEVVSMGALAFSAGQDMGSGDGRSDQLGLIPDVLRELKEIFGILAKEDGDKQDFFSLAAMVSEKYGRIGSSPNIGKINEYIRDHAPFAITLEELENLWD